MPPSSSNRASDHAFLLLGLLGFGMVLCTWAYLEFFGGLKDVELLLGGALSHRFRFDIERPTFADLFNLSVLTADALLMLLRLLETFSFPGARDLDVGVPENVLTDLCSTTGTFVFSVAVCPTSDEQLLLYNRCLCLVDCR